MFLSTLTHALTLLCSTCEQLDQWGRVTWLLADGRRNNLWSSLYLGANIMEHNIQQQKYYCRLVYSLNFINYWVLICGKVNRSSMTLQSIHYQQHVWILYIESSSVFHAERQAAERRRVCSRSPQQGPATQQCCRQSAAQVAQQSSAVHQRCQVHEEFGWAY